MERIMFAAIDIGCYGELPAREHTDTVEAIRRRDPRAARQAMYDQIVGSKEKVMLLAAGSPARISISKTPKLKDAQHDFN
jgi:DNA-binding GntR family transcriptional regulator